MSYRIVRKSRIGTSSARISMYPIAIRRSQFLFSEQPEFPRVPHSLGTKLSSSGSP